jgi:tetratricopeptide (TPR) repeat protein
MISLNVRSSFRLVVAFQVAGLVGFGQQIGPQAGSQASGFANSFQPKANIPDAPRETNAKPQISDELRGDIYMARKMYREAIDMYRQGPPNSPVLANKIGIAFHQLSLLSLARKNYQRAISLNPQYGEAINNLGTIYYAEKNYRRSIILYKRALKFSPPTASIYSNLGAAYFGRKDYKQAIAYYQQALQLDPDVFER